MLTQSSRVTRQAVTDERDRLLVEKLDQLGKIGQRPGEPVELVHYYNFYLAGSNLSEKLLRLLKARNAPPT